MRIGIVCPYSFDVPGGVQFHVRDLAEHFIGDGHEVSVLAPADSETELPPLRHVGGPCDGRALQRLRRAAQLRPGHGGQGRALARARRLRRAPPPRADDTERQRARPDGGRGPDRGDLPHLDAALPDDADGIPPPAALAREDRRPHRRERGRPPHGDDPRRGRRDRHPQRRLRRPLRGGTAASRVDRHARAPPTIAFLGRMGEPRKGLPVLADGAARGPRRGAGPAGARGRAGRPQGDHRGVARGGRRGLRVPRRRLRRRQGLAARVGRRLRRAQHRRRELRHHPHRGHVGWRLRARQRPARLLAGARRRGSGRDVRQRAARRPRPHARRAAARPPSTARSSPRRPAACADLRLVGRRRQDPAPSTRRSSRGGWPHSGSRERRWGRFLPGGRSR